MTWNQTQHNIVKAGTSGNSTTTGGQRGWVPQPDGRGTIDILYSCLFTVFLCVWQILCLNLPAKTDGFWQLLRRKIRWALIAILAPDVLLAFVLGQWVYAKRSVRAFDLLGYSQWSLTHAFYAEMGGFVLQPRDGPFFPVNGKHMHWLVAEGYISFPAISKADIEDKSKADTYAKGLTFLQTGWFLLQCIGRAAQQLSLTTLELTTLAFAMCSIATQLFWLQKPLDVVTPTVLVTDASIAEIHVKAGSVANEPYRYTPLDFVDNFAPSWSFNVTPHLGWKTGPQGRPLSRLPNDRLPNLHHSRVFILFAITMMYSGLHVFGWNFTFASRAEQLLWRVCCLIQVGATFIFWAAERGFVWYSRGRYQKWIHFVFPKLVTIDETKHTQETETQDRIPSLLPLWEYALFIGVAAIYGLARIYLLVEVFVGMRSLPDVIFQTVNWTNFLPHV